MAKTKSPKRLGGALLALCAIVFFGIGIYKYANSANAWSLRDSCTQDFDNISQSDCVTKYEIIATVHEESARNAGLFCVSLGVITLVVSIILLTDRK